MGGKGREGKTLLGEGRTREIWEQDCAWGKIGAPEGQTNEWKYAAARMGVGGFSRKSQRPRLREVPKNQCK